LNRLYLYVRDTKTRELYAVEPHHYYQKIKGASQLFQGITDSTMTHGHGWHFIQTGRYLERAGAIASLVSTNLLPLLEATDPSEIYLGCLGILKSCTAWEAYCKVYSAELDPHHVMQFLLLSKEFPHSLHLCVDQLALAFRALAEGTGMTARRGLEPVVGRLLADLRYTPIEEVGQLHGRPEAFLAAVRKTLGEAHSLLYRFYLS
ncbi:unnamed protein product, partial [Phaeothamnion confervicola]